MSINMIEVDPPTSSAAALRVAVEQERVGGLAKSWRSVTVLLDAFRLPKLTPEACEAMTEQLATYGLASLPALADCDRQSKVRLLLPGEDPGAEQDLLAQGLISATTWHPGRAPRPVELHQLGDRPGGDLAWIDLHPSAEVAAAYQLLGPLVPGLTEEALVNLLQVDDLPAATTYGPVRKVSTVAVHAVEAERGAQVESRSKAGQLVFQSVELLVGEGWLLTCWHEPRGTRARCAPSPLELERRRALDGVAECWPRQERATAGVLGLLLFGELGRTWVPARRALYSWLEQWELDFHRSAAGTEQDTLRELGVLVSEYQRRLTALEESRTIVSEQAWFSPSGASTLDTRIDILLDRSIDGLVSLSTMLRSAIELLTTAGIREHLRLAEVAARKADSLQDQFSLVAAVLLVPTFIAGLFGANTQIPGGGHWSGFIGMLVLMWVGAVGTYALLRRQRRKA